MKALHIITPLPRIEAGELPIHAMPLSLQLNDQGLYVLQILLFEANGKAPAPVDYSAVQLTHVLTADDPLLDVIQSRIKALLEVQRLEVRLENVTPELPRA
jgi:hypothetical protein